MAIGLDTSVVLRLLIGEPRVQMEVARRRIESALIVGEQVVVTDLVVAEAFHALRHHYGVPETMALARLREFLGSGVIHVDPAGAREALGPGARGQAGVVDRLIVARHRAARGLRNLNPRFRFPIGSFKEQPTGHSRSTSSSDCPGV